MKYILLLGRVLFSLIFIVKAVHHCSSEAMSHAIAVGVPVPYLFVPLSGLLSFLGGLSILLGFKARIGAWLLFVFLLPVTLIMHRFWESQEGIVAMLQHLCFMKNLSLIGAVLMIAYFGSGPLSLSKSSPLKK